MEKYKSFRPNLRRSGGRTALQFPDIFRHRAVNIQIIVAQTVHFCKPHTFLLFFYLTPNSRSAYIGNGQ